jgi:hypothetical protein
MGAECWELCIHSIITPPPRTSYSCSIPALVPAASSEPLWLKCRAFMHPPLPSSVCESLPARQHTPAYASIRQHTLACVSIRQHTSAYASIRQHTPAYVSIVNIRRIRQHGINAYPPFPSTVCESLPACLRYNSIHT